MVKRSHVPAAPVQPPERSGGKKWHLVNDPPLYLYIFKSRRIASIRFVTSFFNQSIVACGISRRFGFFPFRALLFGFESMSASPILNSPPPRRPPPEERVQTRSSGPASSPCVLCSPPAREVSLRSPLDGRMRDESRPPPL